MLVVCLETVCVRVFKKKFTEFIVILIGLYVPFSVFINLLINISQLTINRTIIPTISYMGWMWERSGQAHILCGVDLGKPISYMG